jgi:hypothetical protein
VCHSCRFFYYNVEVFQQCVILVDFSIIFWWCSDSVSFLSIFNRKIDKNDTLSEHLHNIIEKSTGDDTLSKHLYNIIEKSIRDDTLSEHLQNIFFYYILEVFQLCVILVDFSIIFWWCSDSVSFLSIFLLYFGGVPTVCHLLSIFLLYCRGVSTECHLLSIFPEHLQNIIEK